MRKIATYCRVEVLPLKLPRSAVIEESQLCRLARMAMSIGIGREDAKIIVKNLEQELTRVKHSCSLSFPRCHDGVLLSRRRGQSACQQAL